MHYYIDVAIYPEANMIVSDSTLMLALALIIVIIREGLVARHLNVISTAIFYCPTLGTMYSQGSARYFLYVARLTLSHRQDDK